MRALTFVAGGHLLIAAACTSVEVTPVDAGDDHIFVLNPDVSAPPIEAGPPRMEPHDGVTLPAVRLGVVYVGELDAGGAPGVDPMLSWVLGSPYWAMLEEYGIHAGTVAGSVRVPTSAIVQSGDVDANGLIDVMALQARIAQSLHGGAVTIANAEAYLFFLPDGLDVALGHTGTYTFRTCVDAYGYHGWDALEPYIVLPPCPEGRSMYATSHELIEMVTDPQPYDGWASDGDIGKNGGEVADVCEEKVMQEGVVVSRFWSNAAARCVP